VIIITSAKHHNKIDPIKEKLSPPHAANLNILLYVNEGRAAVQQFMI
jgi:hypothetical protein